MSDESELAMPPWLDLLRVVVPSPIEYLVRGWRLFIPAIEIWNRHVVIHMTWPVNPTSFGSHDGSYSLLFAFDNLGTQYVFVGGGGGDGGFGSTTFEHVSEFPLAPGAHRLDLIFGIEPSSRVVVSVELG